MPRHRWSWARCVTWCLCLHSFLPPWISSSQHLGSLYKKIHQPSPFHTYHCLWGCSGLALSLGLNSSKFKAASKNFPGGLVVKISPSNAGGAGSTPSRGGAKIHMLFGQKTITRSRSSIVTNSMKTLKMVHIKKKKNLFLKKAADSVQFCQRCKPKISRFRKETQQGDYSQEFTVFPLG